MHEPVHVEWRTYLLLAWLSLLHNGFGASILSYASLPYGNSIYNAASSLWIALSPIGALAAFITPDTDARHQWMQACTLLAHFYCATDDCTQGASAVTWSVLSAYVVAVSVASPAPPLQHHPAGPALLLAAVTLCAFLQAYSQVRPSTHWPL